MTISPHELPPSGTLTDIAAGLRAIVPELYTSRIRMRAIRLEDFPTWASIFCSKRARWIGGPYERDDAFIEFAASAGSWLLRGYGCWAIEDLGTGETLGFTAIHMDPTVREPELGYLLSEQAEGQGLAFEAASAVRDWAWAHGLPSLVSYIDPANTRSADLAKRLGARLDPEADAPNLPEKVVYRYPFPESSE